MYILIVEDDMHLRSAYGIKLKKNYEIGYACDGKKAVEMTKKRKPDLVILDMWMGEFGGEYFLNNIEKEFPIVVVTNQENPVIDGVDIVLRKMDTKLSDIVNIVGKMLKS